MRIHCQVQPRLTGVTRGNRVALDAAPGGEAGTLVADSEVGGEKHADPAGLATSRRRVCLALRVNSPHHAVLLVQAPAGEAARQVLHLHDARSAAKQRLCP